MESFAKAIAGMMRAVVCGKGKVMVCMLCGTHTNGTGTVYDSLFVM